MDLRFFVVVFFCFFFNLVGFVISFSGFHSSWGEIYLSDFMSSKVNYNMSLIPQTRWFYVQLVEHIQFYLHLALKFLKKKNVTCQLTFENTKVFRQ